MTKNQIAIILAIIGAIGGVAGGSYAFDLSNTVITDSSTSIDEGDTNFFEFGSDFAEDATMTFICSQDKIPETHIKACEEWNSEP